VLSVAAGATVFLTVLLVGREPGSEPTDLARYYTTEAIPQGGGQNVVNVILTDYRALDTLGEIVVIGVAALSIVVLITMRDRGEAS
jgi:multicomponent Na+:H+ antiporter subunit A